MQFIQLQNISIRDLWPSKPGDESSLRRGIYNPTKYFADSFLPVYHHTTIRTSPFCSHEPQQKQNPHSARKGYRSTAVQCKQLQKLFFSYIPECRFSHSMAPQIKICQGDTEVLVQSRQVSKGVKLRFHGDFTGVRKRRRRLRTANSFYLMRSLYIFDVPAIFQWIVLLLRYKMK